MYNTILLMYVKKESMHQTANFSTQRKTFPHTYHESSHKNIMKEIM